MTNWPQRAEKEGEEMQGHLETSLRDNPHVEGRRRPPPPISCPGTVAWEEVPGGGRAKVEAKLSLQETVSNVPGRQLALQVPVGFVEGGRGDL